MNDNRLSEKFYQSKSFEKLVDLQNKTVSKWQSYLLRNKLYSKWTSYKYSNTIHWGLLLGLVIGIFVGIMLPISAPKSPGRGQEFEIISASSRTTIVTAYPNLLNLEDSANLEITLLDENKNPLTDRTLQINSSDENVEIITTTESTNESGKLFAKINAKSTGIKEIIITDISTNNILDIETQIEFTDNEVQIWEKIGSVGEEGASIINLPKDSNYKQWSIQDFQLSANLEKLYDKENFVKDSCVYFNKEIYCLGGIDNENVPQNIFYKINQNNIITILESLPSPIYNHKLYISANEILVIGGNKNGNVSDQIFRFDTTQNKWSKLKDLIYPRENFEIQFLDNELYAIGGYNGENQINKVEVFTDGVWREIRGMSTHRNYHSSAIANNRIYVFGGWDGVNVQNTGEVYDKDQDRWFKISNMPIERWNHKSIYFNNEIYLIGGVNEKNEFVSQIDVYDPYANSWRTIQSEINNKNFSISKTNESILIIGGDKSPTEIISFQPEDYPIIVNQNNNVRMSGTPSTQVNFVNNQSENIWISKKIEEIDLSNTTTLKLQLYTSEVLEGNLEFGIGENSYTENVFPINIEKKELWTEIELDISSINNQDKNEIKELAFRITDWEKYFKLNIYDIWSENIFYSECPCTETVEDIFFIKKEKQSWSKLSISSLNGETSEIDIFYRSSNNTNDLEKRNWVKLNPPYSIDSIINNNLEFKLVLTDQEIKGLPELRSVSVEINALPE